MVFHGPRNTHILYRDGICTKPLILVVVHPAYPLISDPDNFRVGLMVPNFLKILL